MALLRAFVSLWFAVCFFTSCGVAQVSPAGRWVTMHSEHFRVHYRPGADSVAGHAMNEGERAYTLLSTELVPPRQKIDLVLSDAADFANGAASVFPSNRILILLTPPPALPDLQNYDDWIRILLVHELTHLFHLDRVKGPWRLAQSVLGRVPGLFPNGYQPSWVAEGLATYYESRFSTRGRVRGSFHSQLLLAAARGGRWPGPNEATYISEKWPNGIAPYAFGSRFFQHLSSTAGDSAIPRFIEATSGQWIPVRTGRPLRTGAGVDRDSAWTAMEERYDSVANEYPASSAEVIEAELRSPPAAAVGENGSLAWYSATGDDGQAVVVRQHDGEEDRYRTTANVDLAWAGDTLYLTRLDLTDPLTYRSDLHRLVQGNWEQITHGQRLTDIDAGSPGVVAVQIHENGDRLVILSGDSVVSLTIDPSRTTWASPAIRPGGAIFAIQHDGVGYNLVPIVPATGREGALVSSTGSEVLADPRWLADGSGLLFVSDRTGLPQVYLFDWDEGARQITSEPGGASQPALSPDGWLYFTTVEADGYALKRIKWADRWTGGPADSQSDRRTGVTNGVILNLSAAKGKDLLETKRDPSVAFAARRLPQDDPGELTTVLPSYRPTAIPPLKVSGYTAWPSLRPHYFIPYAVDKGSAGLFVGGFTSGADVLGRLGYAARFAVAPKSGRVDASFSMVYRRWTRHAVEFFMAQDNGDAGVVVTSTLIPVQSRERDVALGFSTSWRKWYRALTLHIAGDYEEDRFFTSAPVTFFNPEFVAASVGLGMSQGVRPPLAISDEDGVSLSLRYRRRWRLDQDGWSDEIRGRMAGYLGIKGVGLFAHPVLAVRLAAGSSSGPDRETFGIGGASGIAYQPLPGIVAGSGRQFPVRGFEAGELRGGTVAVGTAELRVPIALVAKPIGDLPYGLNRVSLRLFYDQGRVWEPPAGGLPGWIHSTGVEITWDLVVLYDVPLRLRSGIALALNPGRVTQRGDVSFGVGFGSEF